MNRDFLYLAVVVWIAAIGMIVLGAVMFYWYRHP